MGDGAAESNAVGGERHEPGPAEQEIDAGKTACCARRRMRRRKRVKYSRETAAPHVSSI